MDDASIFSAGMVAVNVLAGPVILLVGGLVVIAFTRRRSGGGSSGSAVRWGCGMLMLLPICGFWGLMVATAGGAIHPPLVTVAAPYVCDGTVETRSQGYSYKPGQHGVSRTIFCVEAGGERRDITLRAIGAATIYYTLIFLPIGLVLGLIVRAMVRRGLKSLSEKAGVGPADMAELRSVFTNQLRTRADIARRFTEAAPASGENAEDRLRRLQTLRDGGLISEEEYQAKRAEILAGL